MLIVDPRAGSRDLQPHLVARGLPAQLGQMEFGDVSFIGNGPHGMVSIGVEYKRVSDALSCMTGGRFAGHQLPGLAKTYAHYWLLIEGVTRCGQGNGSDGVLQVQAWPEGWKDCRQGTRYIMWRDYQHWLMSLQQMGGVCVATVANIRESAAWVASLYSWWQKDWDDHKAVNVLYAGPPPANGIMGNIVPPTLKRLWAMQLPGIGQERSKQVEQAFNTALDMAIASEHHWQSMAGIGKVTAKKIVAAIRGTDHD